jgi:6-phosphofructo-2-kinase/fructose-2,6-biphosphatase 4
MINAGERIIVNNCRFGYLPNRIVFYLMNLHIKSRQTYFARAGVSSQQDSYKADASLCIEGEGYSQRLCNALLEHRKREREEFIRQGGSDEELKPLTVWTSTRRRTVQTAARLQERGFKVKQRPQMSQLNPGDVERMTEEEVENRFPADWEKHQLDPYHHRFPRAEVSNEGDPKSLHHPGSLV